MTALIFHDEVFIERNPSEQSASCEFEFKGHHFQLTHRHEFSLHHNKHHFSCKFDDQHFSFGVVRSRLGSGSFGNKHLIQIEEKNYRFSVHWPDSNGRFGVRLGVVTN
jgi:hypothetical protein